MFSLAGNLVFKKFARRDLSTLKEMIAHKIGVFSIATIAVVSVYIVAAPYIFKFVFPAYQEAVLLSQILILAVLLKPFMLYTQVFASHGLKRAQYFIQISTTIIKLSLLLVLLPIYGLWGAVWTTLIASLYWGIIAAILFTAKKYRIHKTKLVWLIISLKRHQSFLGVYKIFFGNRNHVYMRRDQIKYGINNRILYIKRPCLYNQPSSRFYCFD